jgi:translocator protein
VSTINLQRKIDVPVFILRKGQENMSTTASLSKARTSGTTAYGSLRDEQGVEVSVPATTTSIWSSNCELRSLKWINLVAYAVNAAVTYGFGTLGWLNLPTNAEQSAKYQTLITPIGWAFSIWGIIFVTQFIWAVQQFSCWVLPEYLVEAITTVNCNYVLVVLAQIGWTLSFSNDFIEVSLVMMILLLWNLFVACTSIQRISQPVSSNISVPPKSFMMRFTNYVLTEFPFTVHFSWILVATFVNISITLVASGASSMIKYYSALLSLLVLLLSTLVLVFLRSAFVPPLVVIWALFGIYKELESPNDLIIASYTEEQQKNVQYGALGGIVFLVVILFIQCLRVIFKGDRRTTASGPTREDNYMLFQTQN